MHTHFYNILTTGAYICCVWNDVLFENVIEISVARECIYIKMHNCVCNVLSLKKVTREMFLDRY